jgi:hypothetical protein
VLSLCRVLLCRTRPQLALLCAVLCLGCEELFNTLLFGPELCAEGIVTDEAGDPVSRATVALIWHCSGTECTSLDCSDCSDLGSEHVLTDSTGYYKVTDRVLDGDCTCSECEWDLKADAPGYRQVKHERLGWISRDCYRCEIRNFTLQRSD